MALHTHLPIYKLAYDLLNLASDLARNMPRDFKASLGGRIRDECLECIVLIARANASSNKLPHITGLLEHLQVAELLLRLSHDKRFVSHAQWARAVDLTERIGRQASGWRRHFAAAPEQMDDAGCAGGRTANAEALDEVQA